VLRVGLIQALGTMDTSTRADKFISRAFAGTAVLLALAIPLTLFYGNLVSQSPGNVDSGAFLPIFAFGYLLPAFGLCIATVFARYKQWHDRRAVQWLTLVWLAVPGVVLLGSVLFG
jgi:hypothetical protein